VVCSLTLNSSFALVFGPVFKCKNCSIWGYAVNLGTSLTYATDILDCLRCLLNCLAKLAATLRLKNCCEEQAKTRCFLQGELPKFDKITGVPRQPLATLQQATEEPTHCPWMERMLRQVQEEPEKHLEYIRENDQLYRRSIQRLDDEDYMPLHCAFRRNIARGSPMNATINQQPVTREYGRRST